MKKVFNIWEVDFVDISPEAKYRQNPPQKLSNIPTTIYLVQGIVSFGPTLDLANF